MVNLGKMFEQTREAMRVQQVFGDPVERDGTTLIPTALVQGASGGGEDGTSGDKASVGGGWLARARPVGAYVIRGNDITWQPALDVTRIVVGGQMVAIVALLTLRTWLRHRR